MEKSKYSQLPDEDFRNELPEETHKQVRSVLEYLNQMEMSISHYLTNVLERERTLCAILPKTLATLCYQWLTFLDEDMNWL
jgi:transcription termination factor NusB